MWFSKIWMLLCLVLLLVTGICGQEDKRRDGEDPGDRAANTTRGYSGTTSSDRLGVIMSPGYPGNYPNSYHFRYDIYLGTEKSDLEINFKIFDLEYCSNCDCDYIEIENNKLAKPLKYCGAALPNGDGQVLLDNLNDYVWITFQSNSDQRRPGFYATYEVTQRSGNDSFLAGGSVCPPVACPYCDVGQTPEYDYTGVCTYCFCNKYQENTTPKTSLCPPVVCPSCPYGFRIHMDYSSQKCTQCYCVHDQQSTTKTYYHSTSHRPLKTTSYRPWQTTTPRTMKTNGYQPWQAVNQTTHPHYAPETTTSKYVGCGQRYFTNSTGVITSPGSPGYYPPNSNCYYDIDLGGAAGARKTVALTFNFFNLEICPDCSCDALTISGEETDHLRMCDEDKVNLSRTYYVHKSSEILKLHFTTDSTAYESGFSVNYEVLSSEVDETCGNNDNCSSCNTSIRLDYFGCCYCSRGLATPGYSLNSTGVYSKSLLLQMLTNIAHHAQILEQYARDVETEANNAKNLVAQSFG